MGNRRNKMEVDTNIIFSDIILEWVYFSQPQ